MPTNKGFSAEERAAMKERAAELKAQKTKEDGERAVQQAIAKMPEPDRTMAAKVHEIVTKAAPELAPRTWYGMPAYSRNDKVVCFFKAASKFKSRYAVLGFSDEANLDDGAMWPTDYAVLKLTGAVEKQIRTLVKQAVS